MSEYRRRSPMNATRLKGEIVLGRAKCMGAKAAKGTDLWLILLLKRLPWPFGIWQSYHR